MDDKTTILVIEDNKDHQHLIKLVLAKGLPLARVDCTTGGEDAQSYLLERDPPSLIVLDHWLPGMSGIDLLKWLASQEQLADIPVIMFTSSQDARHAQQAYALGVRRYLVKPNDFKELVGEIKDTLDHWVDPEVGSAEA